MNSRPDKDGTLPLAGALTMETVNKLFREFTPLWREGGGPTAIDLSGAERIDSAGLALLLEWQAQARNRGQALALQNPPDDLLTLAALCEANDLLGLASSEPGQ